MPPAMGHRVVTCWQPDLASLVTIPIDVFRTACLHKEMVPMCFFRRSLWVASCLAALLAAAGSLRAERPKLIVFIAVDQLRGDMPLRFRDRFSGGLKRLLDQGVVYTQAHYQHATTFTAVGHATLATGGSAAQHGMAANDWYDAATKREVYCVEDDRHKLLGLPGAPHDGTSPRNLTSSTFGDELVVATNGQSRVFAVSGKDRGAILCGGHLGKAFWYASSSGEFVTSTYYYDEYPTWVAEWNRAKPALLYREAQWDLLYDRDTYLLADRDDRPFERSFKNLGRTFPHPLQHDKPSDFYSALRFTPMSDELALDFARRLVVEEQLGGGKATDVLAISLAATDYIGHAFGPNSLEAEDNLMRIDHQLGELLAFLDQQIGADRMLVVLTSDHGVNAAPEHTLALGMNSGRLQPSEFLATVNAALQRRFGVDQPLVIGFFNPGLYLDLDLLKEKGLEVVAVERAVAEEMLSVAGISKAFTRTDMLAGNIPPDPIAAKVYRAFHPTRSGNVLLVQDVSWYMYASPEVFSGMHGSPYAYDTYVPIIFAGAGIKPQMVERPVGPEDVAATIAGYLGIDPPSGSVGTALFEVLAAD